LQAGRDVQQFDWKVKSGGVAGLKAATKALAKKRSPQQVPAEEPIVLFHSDKACQHSMTTHS